MVWSASAEIAKKGNLWVETIFYYARENNPVFLMPDIFIVLTKT